MSTPTDRARALLAQWDANNSEYSVAIAAAAVTGDNADRERAYLARKKCDEMRYKFDAETVRDLLAALDAQRDENARLRDALDRVCIELEGTHEHMQNVLDGNETNTDDPADILGQLRRDLDKAYDLDMRVIANVRALLTPAKEALEYDPVNGVYRCPECKRYETERTALVHRAGCSRATEGTV